MTAGRDVPAPGRPPVDAPWEEAVPPLRITVPTRLVLAELLAARATELYTLQIANQAGLGPSTTYYVLLRLQRSGCAHSRWEHANPHTAGRPRRRYWRLTAAGVTLATHAHGPTERDTLPAEQGDGIPPPTRRRGGPRTATEPCSAHAGGRYAR